MNQGMRNIFKNKKAAFFIMTFTLITILSVAGTYASFTGGKSVTNTLEAGTVIAEVYENCNPSDGLTLEDNWTQEIHTKMVQIKNAGTAPSYIRVNLIPLWHKDGQILPNNNVIYGNLNDTDWSYNPEDGYFYYKYIVESGDLTEPLFETVSIDPTVIANPNVNYDEATLEISILAEIVQVANDAATSVWGINSTELGLEQ